MVIGMSIEWPFQSVFIACLFNVIFASISFFATLMAIVAYFSSTTLRQAYQNVLFLNLLVNALIVSVNVIFFCGHAAIMGNSNVLLGWGCSLNGFINIFCCGIETYTLMCIALERYFAIKQQTILNFNQIALMLLFGYFWVGIMSR